MLEHRVVSVLALISLCALPTGVTASAKQPAGKPTRPAVSAPAAKKPPVKSSTAKAPVKSAYSAATAKARRARIARARAEARARDLREAQTPRFTLNELGQQVPDLRAEAAIIYNPQTNEVLWESHAQDQRSIASITKLMTALVFVESGLPLTTKVKVERADVYRASTTYLRSGYELTADDLLNLLLIGSDNAAARVLARMSPYGATGFVARMNAKAVELGLSSTQYAEPSGLYAANLSSAYDMARLVAHVATDDLIGAIMRRASHTIYAGKRAISVHSTNQLVRTGEYDVLGGKTGFITRSGYCLATLLRLPQSGQQVAVVVLGAKSNNGRFWETRHLMNWFAGQPAFGGRPALQ